MEEQQMQYLFGAIFLITIVGLIYSGFTGFSGAVTQIDTGHCSDSDGGQNALVAGTCGDDYIGGLQDSCAGDKVKEYWCTANNVCTTTNLECPEGTACRYGKCQ